MRMQTTLIFKASLLLGQVLLGDEQKSCLKETTCLLLRELTVLHPNLRNNIYIKVNKKCIAGAYNIILSAILQQGICMIGGGILGVAGMEEGLRLEED